jgi:hypothetical protein
MTKKEILAMKPGRELDKVVGEIVFGYEVKIFLFQGFAPDPYYRTPSQYGRTYEFLPNYSTDISAAWQVVEKLFREGYGLLMIGDVDKFTVILAADMNYKAEAKTAPEAICKAALLAKLEEGKSGT